MPTGCVVSVSVIVMPMMIVSRGVMPMMMVSRGMMPMVIVSRRVMATRMNDMLSKLSGSISARRRHQSYRSIKRATLSNAFQHQRIHPGLGHDRLDGLERI